MTDRFAELEARLARIEDERAIERMIASYGPLVDAGEAEAAAQLWALDGSYAVEGWSMNNRAEVADMVRSEAHQGLIGGGSTHFLGPAVVTVDVDDAVAVCESLSWYGMRRSTWWPAPGCTTSSCAGSTAAGRSSGGSAGPWTATRRHAGCLLPGSPV